MVGACALAFGSGGLLATIAAASTTTSTTPLSGPSSTAPATTTTTTPGTPTTLSPPSTVPPGEPVLPPPPRFPAGDDFGRLLLQHHKDGEAALAVAKVDIANGAQLVRIASARYAQARRDEADARAHEREVLRRLVQVKDEIRALAVQAYMLGSDGRIGGFLASLQSAQDFVGLTRNLTLIDSSHDRLFDLVAEAHVEQSRAAAHVRSTATATGERLAEWQDSVAAYTDANQRLVDAQAEIAQSEQDQVRFFALAKTSASPIMGPSLLTADQLVAYLDSIDAHPHLTVPIRTLAQYYIEEGNDEGVRGDVAFAQSILETGAFMFPGHGLLDPGDNNFGGIDACDSCKHGDKFATARIGVRRADPAAAHLRGPDDREDHRPRAPPRAVARTAPRLRGWRQDVVLARRQVGDRQELRLPPLRRLQADRLRRATPLNRECPF